MFNKEMFKGLNKEQLKVLIEAVSYAHTQAVESRIPIIVDDADDEAQYEYQRDTFVSALEALYDAEYDL